MKVLMSLLLLIAVFHAQAEDKCLCGTYKYDYTYAGNSTNHYRLLDGTFNPALIRDTERAVDGKWILTEVLIEWPGRKKNYIPALDQIANDGDKICVKGDMQKAVVKGVSTGASENLTYFESVENVFKAGSDCEGEPITINIENVKKAELPR